MSHSSHSDERATDPLYAPPTVPPPYRSSGEGGNGNGGHPEPPRYANPDAMFTAWLIKTVDEQQAARHADLIERFNRLDDEAAKSAKLQEKLAVAIGAANQRLGAIEGRQTPQWVIRLGLLCFVVIAGVTALNYLGVSLG